MEQTRMVFTATCDGSNFIDLTKALTLVNGKHYTQFKKDKPLAYTAIIRLSSAGNRVVAAPTSWAVRNACVKAAASWRKMLSKAGISKRDLNTYGKELRIPLDIYHRGAWGSQDSSAHEVFPTHLADGNGRIEFDTGMHDSSGNAIYSTAFTTTDSEFNSAVSGVYREHAFDKTIFTVPDPDAADNAFSWSPILIGGGSGGGTSLVSSYINSRDKSVDTHDDDFDTVIGNPDNYLTLMLSDNEESADDVIEDVQDQGDFRPYSLEYQNTHVPVIEAGMTVAGQDTSIVAPLGLLRWTARPNDLLVVTVTGHMEM